MKFVLFLCLSSFFLAEDQIPSDNNYPPNLLIPQYVKGKWGYCDTLGQQRIPAVYDSAYFFSQPSYDQTQYFTIAQKEGKLGIINGQNETVLPFQYEKIKYVNHFIPLPYKERNYDLLHVREQQQEAIIKLNGNAIISGMDSIWSESYHSYCVVGFKDGKARIYNQQGNLLNNENYIDIVDGKDINFYPKGDWYTKIFITADSSYHILGWSFIKYTKTQVDSIYTRTDSPIGTVAGFSDGIAGKRAFLSPMLKALQQELAIDSFDFARSFKDQDNWKTAYHGVFKDGKYLILDIKKKELFDFETDDITAIIDFSQYKSLKEKYGFEKLYVARRDDKMGVLTEDKTIFLPFIYNAIDARHAQSEYIFYLKKKKHYGAKLIFTNYPLLKPKYEAITKGPSLSVSPTWVFATYQVKKKGKTVYVGENGIEYFKL